MNESDEVEVEDDVVEETTTTRKKRAGAANGTAAKAPSKGALAAWGDVISATGREINVERVTGPNGKNVYRQRPVQCAICPEKLPPEAASNLVQAITEKWGGGHYKAWPDNPKPNEILYPIKVAGRPKPLDPAQALDDEEEAAERELYQNQPLPPLNGGGYGPGGYGPGLPPLDPYAARPGGYFDPASGMRMPVMPYQDPQRREIEKENQELRRKVELEPLQRTIEDLKKDREQPKTGAVDYFGRLIEMMTLQNAEREKERAHQLVVEREERKARAEREEKEREARLTLEREERKAKEERERQDRLDREAERNKMFELMMANSNNLVKVMTSEAGGSRKSDPVEGMVKMVTVMSGIKDLTTPPGKSETAELIEAGTAAAEKVIGTTADAVARVKGGGGGSGGGVQPPTDERMQMLDVMDYVAGLAKSGRVSPKSAYTAICAFCAGRGYDSEKILAKLREYHEQAAIDKLRADLKEYSTSSMVPEKVRPQIADVAKVLDEPQHQQWLLELGMVAKG